MISYGSDVTLWEQRMWVLNIFQNHQEVLEEPAQKGEFLKSQWGTHNSISPTIMKIKKNIGKPKRHHKNIVGKFTIIIMAILGNFSW